MRRLLDFTHTMRMKYFTILWIQKRLDLDMIRLQCHLHVYFKILRNYSFCAIIGLYSIKLSTEDIKDMDYVENYYMQKHRF